MTDFKVTEEAVEAALDAHHCATHYISPEYAMRRAIEAALPVMFERVGWQVRERFWDGAPWSEWATFNIESDCDHQIEVLEGWLTEKRVVFAIKEPK